MYRLKKAGVHFIPCLFLLYNAFELALQGVVAEGVGFGPTWAMNPNGFQGVIHRRILEENNGL